MLLMQTAIWMLVAAAPPPLAQAEEASNQNVPVLQEIVVSARKRNESLSDVPISIAAYSTEALELSGIKSVVDIIAFTPGVDLTTDGAYTSIVIRGVNSPTAASTVGMYIDDTPIQTRNNNVNFFSNPLPLMFDVDRVEVARGPQGTLFGAGAEGGSIRFISPEPGLEKYTGFARTEISFTEYGAPSAEVGAAVGGPIVTDKLGFRVSAWFRRDGGYLDRVDPFSLQTVESNSNWTNSYAVRGAVAWAAADWIRVTPSLYAQSVHVNDMSNYYEYLSDPNRGVFKTGRLFAQPSTDKFILPSLKIEADLGWGSATSITSYIDREGEQTEDYTSRIGAFLTGYGGADNAFPTSYSNAAPVFANHYFHQVSQELRLASSDPRVALRWTAGVFYSRGLQGDTQQTYSPYFQTTLFGGPANSPIKDADFYTDDRQIAGFGQVDWRIIDPLTLTLGLRVAHVRTITSQAQSGPFVAGTPPEGPTTTYDETPVTPKVGLAYKLDDQNMLYATVGKGYRVGGGNQAIPLQTASNPYGCAVPDQPGTFKSDWIWSYELGAKNKLFNGRLQLNTSVFHVDWYNIQQFVNILQCGSGYIANTGKAVSNGFDLEATAALTRALLVDLAVAYTNAHTTETVYQYGAPVATAGEVLGFPPYVISPWNLKGSVQYSFTVLGGRDAYVRVEDIYHSRNPGPFNSYNPDSPYYFPTIPPNPPTNELNLRAGVNWSRLDLALFINNVLGAHPTLQRYADTPNTSLFTDYTLRPLTVGVSASYRF
jgi:outer membrane receptor protein involved in Fe transport